MPKQRNRRRRHASPNQVPGGPTRLGRNFGSNSDRLQDLGGMSHGGSDKQIANASTTNTQAGQDISLDMVFGSILVRLGPIQHFPAAQQARSSDDQHRLAMPVDLADGRCTRPSPRCHSRRKLHFCPNLRRPPTSVVLYFRQALSIRGHSRPLLIAQGKYGPPPKRAPIPLVKVNPTERASPLSTSMNSIIGTTVPSAELPPWS